MSYTKKVYFGSKSIKYITNIDYPNKKANEVYNLSKGGGYVKNNPDGPIQVNLNLTVPRYVKGELENIRAISKITGRYIYKDDNVSFYGKIYEYEESEEFDDTITCNLVIAEHREPDIKVAKFNSYNYTSIQSKNKQTLLAMFKYCMFPTSASSNKASTRFKYIQRFLKKYYNYNGKLDGKKSTKTNKAIKLLRQKNKLSSGTNWDLVVAKWFVKKYNKQLKKNGLIEKYNKQLKKYKVIK
ncbi:MAG: hypothetical protein ISP01_09550 [Methanobrevibacter arboriphilus]|uniref:Uncharacterized protein n=1 Tax=Methanobrevibacter arboriphilus TaxID=39441 RepID=A0A843AKN7_METAZ|nr:hypothetical protein [Methanobrevibacter arboriphilus]MBF4469635.1 hypothetical protein [Methanobrevibacter arboriphilus]